MIGIKKNVMIKPPMKKPITAINEGICRLANPLIACPEVQPPAHLEPNPIKTPPTTMKIKPFQVSNASKLNSSVG